MGRTYLDSEEKAQEMVVASSIEEIQPKTVEAAFEPVKLKPHSSKPASEMDIADSRETLYDIMMRQEQIHEPLPLRVY